MKEKITTILKNEARTVPDTTALLKKTTMKQASGCDACGGKGYKGRIGVFETVLINDAMQSLIHTSPDELKIRELARQQGSVSLMADGLIKVLQGLTDIAEVEKMIGPIG